jgi:hypothetical protein
MRLFSTTAQANMSDIRGHDHPYQAKRKMGEVTSPFCVKYTYSYTYNYSCSRRIHTLIEPKRITSQYSVKSKLTPV